MARSPASVAASRLLARRRARASCLDYAKYITVPGRAISEDPDEWVFHPIESGLASHHALLLRQLDRIASGELKRLMVFMPPGSAKSTYASVVFPTYMMGKKPGTQIILGSYATDIAKKHGRRARQIVQSEQYRALFSTDIKGDQKAANEWALASGSEYMSGGMLSGLTGNRADGIIIDDPVRGRKDADSEATQKATREAYEDDLLTRLKPGGWEIIIQTRWNELDLSGGILPEDYDGESGPVLCRDGHTWQIISIPAQADRDDDPLNRDVGEYLWPEWFTPEHWERFQGNKRTWSALFQQRPQPESGTFFQREWFRWYDIRPRHLNIYLCSDYAVTDDAGDYTEHGVFGIDPEDNVYVLDWWTGQKGADVWIDAQLDLEARHKPLLAVGEAGQIRRAIEPFLSGRRRKRRVYSRQHWVTRDRDKASMARGFQAFASMGKVYLPSGVEWAQELLDQLIRFPAGRNDDKVDVCALAGMIADRQIPAAIPSLPPHQIDRGYAPIDEGDDELGWKAA